jgi:Uma2 family endonuclease
MTLAEWADLDEDEPGELVDGQLVEEEHVGYAHDTTVGWAVSLLRAWLVPRGGRAATSDVRFAVSPTRGRKPDVTAYLPESRKPPANGLVRVPPDIAIEVVSPTPRDARRDRVEKRREYAAFGVRWYWIIDPAARTVEFYELGPGGLYVCALDATEGIVDNVLGCAGLTLDLDALWRELDELEAETGPIEPEEPAAPLPDEAKP